MNRQFFSVSRTIGRILWLTAGYGVFGTLAATQSIQARAASPGKWSGGSGYAPVGPLQDAPQSDTVASLAARPGLARPRKAVKTPKRLVADLPAPMVPASVLDPAKSFVAVDPLVVEKQEKAVLAALPDPLVPPNVLNRDLKVVRFRIVED